jgi:tetratricopeptide (TPR) repeat protein
VFALVLTLSATGAWADRYSDCSQSKDPDRQIRGCTQIIERGKRESREWRSYAYYNLGLAYQKKGEVDRAIADYTKAIAIDQKYSNAYNNRGLAYYRKSEVDRAIADYDKAIAIDPKYAYAYNGRGAAYQKKGEVDRAIADYRKALEIDPSYSYPKENLKRLGVTL